MRYWHSSCIMNNCASATETIHIYYAPEEIENSISQMHTRHGTITLERNSPPPNKTRSLNKMSYRMIAIVALAVIAFFSINTLRHSTLLHNLSSHRQTVDQIAGEVN